LKSKLVNIFNVINNHRTGEQILHFPTKRHFIDYTWPNRIYPLHRAKADPLKESLLQPVSQKKYNELADKEYAEYMEGVTINGGPP
jgi:hypothetical protein